MNNHHTPDPGSGYNDAQTFKFGPELDLHTFLPGDIPELLEDYLDWAATEGLSEIRIIHGKGASVLKTLVHKKLDRDDRVASLHDDGHNWGASRVILKKSDTP